MTENNKKKRTNFDRKTQKLTFFLDKLNKSNDDSNWMFYCSRDGRQGAGRRQSWRLPEAAPLFPGRARPRARRCRDARTLADPPQSARKSQRRQGQSRNSQKDQSLPMEGQLPILTYQLVIYTLSINSY